MMGHDPHVNFDPLDTCAPQSFPEQFAELREKKWHVRSIGIYMSLIKQHDWVKPA